MGEVNILVESKIKHFFFTFPNNNIKNFIQENSIAKFITFENIIQIVSYFEIFLVSVVSSNSGHS